jgi:hypothetical protein
MNKAAQQLGRLAKGVPKTLSPSALAQRRKNLAAINAARKKRKTQTQEANAIAEGRP